MKKTADAPWARLRSSFDVVPVAGVDLPCATGRLGLQGATVALPGALGFDPLYE